MYANVFRTYSVLDAHLLSMETQKLKKQQLEESHSLRSLVAKEEKEGEKEETTEDKKEKEEVKKLVKKKPARKDSYCDVLQK